jgi:elongator complex protein 6
MFCVRMMLNHSQGLDLDKLALKKRFAFVDGLSGTFLPRQGKAISAKAGNVTLTNPSLVNVFEALQNAVKTLRNTQSAKILLVVDQLDLLLATDGDAVGAVEMGELLMSLREVCSVLLKLWCLEC